MIRKSRFAVALSIVATSNLVVAQVYTVERAAHQGPTFSRAPAGGHVFQAAFQGERLPMRLVQEPRNHLGDPDDGDPPPAEHWELDLEHWDAAGAAAMQACVDAAGGVTRSHVSSCLDKVAESHGPLCLEPDDATCLELTYQASWCGREAQLAHEGDAGWICVRALADAIDAFHASTSIETGFGSLDITEGHFALPRYIVGSGGTTEHHLERAQGLVCEAPASSYFEWDAFISPSSLDYDALRGQAPALPGNGGGGSGTPILYNTTPPPERFVEDLTTVPREALGSCGEAAAEAFHDFSALESDARHIDRKRTPRFITDRILYGGPRGTAKNQRPLVTPTATGVDPDFRDVQDNAIRIPRTYRSWRDRTGEGHTFKNVYWLIDREANVPITGQTHYYRRQLRRFYTMNLSWNHRMREALDGYLPEELSDLAHEQKKLLETYKRYQYLKSLADCEDDPTVEIPQACTAQCLDGFLAADQIYGASFSPGGQSYLPSALALRADQAPMYAQPGGGLVDPAFAGSWTEQSFTGDERMYYPGVGPAGHPLPDGDFDPIGPDPDPIGDPIGPGGGLVDPVDPTTPVIPGHGDPDDPFGLAAGRGCLAACNHEWELLAPLARLQCPTAAARTDYAKQAAELFEREIAPQLERGRLLGCIPDPADDAIPTPCDWSDEEMVGYFEQMYVPQRIHYWHACAEEFGEGSLVPDDFKNRFLDPDSPSGLLSDLPSNHDLKVKIRDWRLKPYLSSPAKLWEFPRDFAEYRAAVAEEVLGEGGLLGTSGLRSSRLEEKTLGNDFIGAAMRFYTTSGHAVGTQSQALHSTRCEMDTDARSEFTFDLAVFGFDVKLADLRTAGDSAETAPDKNRNDFGLGGTFDTGVEINGGVVFEPGAGDQDSDEDQAAQDRWKAWVSIGAHAQYRWIYDYPLVVVDFGPYAKGTLVAGIGATIGVAMNGRYTYEYVNLPREANERNCEDPESHLLEFSARPSIGADFHMAFFVGGAIPFGLEIGNRATLTVVEFALELVAQHFSTNHGESFDVSRGVEAEGSNASTNTSVAVVLTMLAGEVSIVVQAVIGFVRATIFSQTLFRFGGLRFPLATTGKAFDSVDACIVGELSLELVPGVNWTPRRIPDDCPCVFRPHSECPQEEEPAEQEGGS